MTSYATRRRKDVISRVRSGDFENDAVKFSVQIDEDKHINTKLQIRGLSERNHLPNSRESIIIGRQRTARPLISAIVGHLWPGTFQQSKKRLQPSNQLQNALDSEPECLKAAFQEVQTIRKKEKNPCRVQRKTQRTQTNVCCSMKMDFEYILEVEESEFRACFRSESEIHLSDSTLRNRMSLYDGFCCYEFVKNSSDRINIVEGIKLWTDFVTSMEQQNLLTMIDCWEQQGENGQLLGSTFVAPRKWMKGKGRRTLQFGCCYNYAIDSKRRLPGILVEEEVEEMPAILKSIADRLVRWKIVPKNLKPDSAIVNIYSESDCIPPHIDNLEFLRPFVTISLLSETSMSFGTNITALAPGEFEAPFHLPLPVGSCLVLEGKGADVAKHCISAVKQRRISITMRKMHPNFAQKNVKLQKKHESNV